MAEEVGHSLLHMQHAGGTAHHNHAADIAFADAGVFQRLLHWHKGLCHEVLGEGMELGAGEDGIDRCTIA